MSKGEAVAILKDFLRRYTDLPGLIHLLKTKTITFLDPEQWDDKNDAYFMSLYKQATGLKTLLAICCSRETETYHHWRVFSSGASGVCISFKRQLLIDTLKAHSHVRFGEVQYLKIKDLKSRGVDISKMPFLKRAPYHHEREFRFIYESRSGKYSSQSYPIPMNVIDRIYLSPWMHEELANSVRSVLKQIVGLPRIPISRSTLIRNDVWQSYGEKIAGV